MSAFLSLTFHNVTELEITPERFVPEAEDGIPDFHARTIILTMWNHLDSRYETQCISVFDYDVNHGIPLVVPELEDAENALTDLKNQIHNLIDNCHDTPEAMSDTIDAIYALVKPT